jgi:hypothetical protein
MLAFDDQSLARLCISATAVPRHKRRRWLHALAQKLDPPHDIIARRARSRRARERRRNGVSVYTLPLSDRAVEGLITQLITTERLNEADASDRLRFEAALASELICCGRISLHRCALT